MQLVVSLISGFLMSMGLVVSGMVNPQKVIGFLDIGGHFDPTLAFVMAGALLITMIGYRLVKFCAKPVLCESFNMPTSNKIDASLILGAALFGAGWGLAGFCPGPVIVGIGLGFKKALIFVAAMAIGMYAAKVGRSSKVRNALSR